MTEPFDAGARDPGAPDARTGPEAGRDRHAPGMHGAMNAAGGASARAARRDAAPDPGRGAARAAAPGQGEGAAAPARQAADRVFLFLQSHPSFFGRKVIRHMRRQGATCHVINFYLGDWFFRRRTGAVNYTGPLDRWEAYLEAFIDRHGITDIVYYADQRPYHRIARRVARRRGLDATAYEFGYLRPDFITMERGGMGPFSHFPNDPDQVEALAAAAPDVKPAGFHPYGFRDEAINEVMYHLVPWFLPFVFPRYRRDRRYSPLIEYASYVPKLLAKKAAALRAHKVVEEHRASGAPTFFVLMQMQGDYQVRRASPYSHLGTLIEEIVESFARHAPADGRLVFKMHPLENALMNWPRKVRQAARARGIGDRVDCIDGGELGAIYAFAKGVVLLNSTAGLSALLHGVPVKTLGIAVYDMPRLTHQGPLDGFWTAPQKPVKRTADAFRKLLIASVQVKGNFFTKSGRAAAVPEFSRRLMEGDVNSHGAFVEPPPRLARARALGVPMIYED